MIMKEDFVRLNIKEIGIILDSLMLLSKRHENQIDIWRNSPGSVSALYNKLYSVQEDLKLEQTYADHNEAS